MQKQAVKTARQTRPAIGLKAQSPAELPPVTPAQRHQMIARAAYLLAEGRGFIGGDAVADWLEAEADIDCELGKDTREH